MERSESITKLAAALAQFQSDIGTIPRDGNNPFFKSKYATLENIVSTIRPALKEHGLSFSQLPAGENRLTTILMHESGEFLSSTVQMTPKDSTPQGQGSAITYMRRYALSAVLGIVTEEDDDGNQASHVKSPAKASGPRSKPTPTNPALKLKASIFKHLQTLRPNVHVSKDNVQGLVSELTGLDLVEQNYKEIDSRLCVLVDDKQAVQTNVSQ